MAYSRIFVVAKKAKKRWTPTLNGSFLKRFQKIWDRNRENWSTVILYGAHDGQLLFVALVAPSVPYWFGIYKVLMPY